MSVAETGQGDWFSLHSVSKICERELRFAFEHCSWGRSCLLGVHQGSLWSHGAYKVDAEEFGIHTNPTAYSTAGGAGNIAAILPGSKPPDIAEICVSSGNLSCTVL